MDTHFASAERTPADRLDASVRAVAQDPVVANLLECVGGLLAILDGNRQIVAVNPSLLEKLGMDAGECLGLRPGEALGCAHVQEMPGGCGTSRWCGSCGAALAIVAAQQGAAGGERDCALVRDDGSELFLRVRCTPLERDGRSLLALFLRDITREQRLSTLERSFFHDVRGLVTGIAGYADLLGDGTDLRLRRGAEALQEVVQRLVQEMDLQAILMREESVRIAPRREQIEAASLLEEAARQAGGAAREAGIALVVRCDPPGLSFVSDAALLLRVLRNMVANALEAQAPGDRVELRCLEEQGMVRLEVANAARIPEAIRLRIFQRNFSTKGGDGRGMGTWSMRFFGEDVLGGKVSFTSSEGEGTVFSLRLP